VDGPAKEITDLVGVGVGTLYRQFPQRSDLVKAVVESGIDAVAGAGPALIGEYEPAEALISPASSSSFFADAATVVISVRRISRAACLGVHD
jgi:AcrR family transcriptional regulator